MRIQTFHPSIALLTVLFGLSIGCSKHPNDETIAKDIQTKVAAAPETKDSEVQVAAKDGKVTLTGKAKTPAAQQKIEQIAHEEPGATSVEDQTSTDAGAVPSAESASQAAPQAPAAAPLSPPVERPRPQPIVVSAGTLISVRVGQALSSATSKTGQTFIATLARPLNAGGRIAIPRGADLVGTVLNAKAKGRFKGEGELSLALTSVSVRARSYSIQTEPLDSTVKGKGKRSAATTGGGAAGGALIGGLAGGGKGAGIGALVGGGAGLVGGMLTGNKQIEIPVETVLTFQLSRPLTLPPPAE
jgi:BON domain